MRAVATGSDRIGRDLDEALTTPGVKPNQLATTLDGLADLQQQQLGEAEAIQEPGAMSDEQAAALQSLGFRVTGMRRLADVFRATAGSDDASGASLQLAAQANRLVASDVIWADQFRAASLAQMRSDGVSGVPVPESDFVQNPEFGSPGYWEPVFDRVNGAATDGGTTTGGLHGTGIVETKALPSEVVLQTDTDNIVTAGTDLAFAVTIEDTGDNQEVQIKVTLTIDQQPSPIVATKTVDVDQSRRVEDRDVHRPRSGRVRHADDGEGGRAAGGGRGERRQQLCRVPGHLLARLASGSELLDERCRMDRGRRAVVIAIVTLVLLLAAVRDLRRLRAAQSVLLGGAKRDLADFAVSLQTRVDDLHRAVDEVAAAIARVDRRADTTLARTAVVRYDAYEGAGGRQSASVAFLDSSRTGVVLSAIQGRDYARVYIKELDQGKAVIALSPEEQEAVERQQWRPELRTRWLQFRPGAAGTRPQCQLRAPERLLRQAGARARAQAEGRARRGTRPPPAIGRGNLRLAARRSPADVRAGAASRHSGASRAARSSPVTAGSASTAERRGVRLTLDHVVPRSRGGDSVWENVVTSCAPVQPPQGRPAARGGRDGAAEASPPAHAGALHQAPHAAHSHRLAAVPRAACRGGPRVTRARAGDVGHAHRDHEED